MKLLMFNAKNFWYRTFSKTIEAVEDVEKEEELEDALVVFLNTEKEDEERFAKVIVKVADNIMWLARKVVRNRVVLHPFAHLSNSKSSVEIAESLIKGVKDRLDEKGYETHVTPFGYFLEFRIHVLGESLAKVWKEV